MRRVRRNGLLAIGVAVATVLAACGGADAPPTATDATEESAAPDTTAAGPDETVAPDGTDAPDATDAATDTTAAPSGGDGPAGDTETGQG